jgi:hypothetical protein
MIDSNLITSNVGETKNDAGGERVRAGRVGAAFALSLACGAGSVHAEPMPDSDLRVASTRELTLEPQGPERGHLPDPECGTMRYFGDALAAGMEARFDAIYAVADALLPDLSASNDTQLGWGPVLSWPWIVPLGPEQGREVRRGRCADVVIPGLQAHRIVPELGVSFASQTRGWLRLGYNFVWQPKAARFGLVFGASPTLTFGGARAVGSLGPELGLRYGVCCSPGYSTLVARYDEHLLGGSGRTFLLKLGLAYW